MDIAQEILGTFNDDPDLLQEFRTGDESWLYGYDIEINDQSYKWECPGEPRPEKASQLRSNVKVLITVFIDCNGVMHYELLTKDRTVIKKYYLEVMYRLREAIRQKCIELWKT